MSLYLGVTQDNKKTQMFMIHKAQGLVAIAFLVIWHKDTQLRRSSEDVIFEYYAAKQRQVQYFKQNVYTDVSDTKKKLA